MSALVGINRLTDLEGAVDSYHSVIEFWFNETDSKQWFVKDLQFDQLIIERFAGLHAKAVACELYFWREQPLGRLAEIIVLDQFSRNMFRDQPEAFTADALALILAQEAVSHGADKQLPAVQRAFFYMPFMHSESKLIHQVAVDLFSAPGLEGTHAFELTHKAIIDRFGRYPHRNAILGRQSSKQELEFLKQPNSGF